MSKQEKGKVDFKYYSFDGSMGYFVPELSGNTQWYGSCHITKNTIYVGITSRNVQQMTSNSQESNGQEN